MVWNGIERNRLDYILTDLLPVELSEQFSFVRFYDYLSTKERQVDLQKCIEQIKKKRTKGGESVLQGGWATKPLKYRIMKGSDSFREMSIMQPLAALYVYLFIECYQKDMLLHFERNHGFSIRYHKKRTNLFYKGRNRKAIEYFQKQTSQLGKGIIQQTGMYFRVIPFESINAFTDSRVWRIANFRFSNYAKIDYKSCFDSIYTHAFSWLIESNVIDAKDASNSQLFITIDRVLQNINGRSSNGILVGPEFSRMVTEILLGHIDREVESALSQSNIMSAEDYVIYRYVDDIFIFANEQKVINAVIDAYKLVGERYLMRLNELKMVQDRTPCLPKEWLERTRNVAAVISGFFYQGKRTEYLQLPEEKQYLIKSDYIPIDRLKDEISVLTKGYWEDRRSIVSFLLSTLVNNIGKVKNGYRLFGDKNFGKALLLVDFILYIYAYYPSFDQTRKVISLIAYLDREVNFKSNSDMKEKLQKILRRYNFIFQSGNPHDLCDWFSFFIEYGITLDTRTENLVIEKLKQKDDPILWGLILMYSRYNTHFHHIVCENVERLIERQMDRLSDNDTMMQEQFWCVLVYHNCPDISQGHRDSLAKIIEDLKPKSQPPSAPTEICKTILCEFLQQKSVNGKKPEDSFFNWKVSQGFSERIAYRTHQRTLFKGYRDNKHGFYSSLD